MPDPLKSPLADLHVSRGARLAAYHGALVPARFSDPAAEHLAVRNSVGVFDFAFRVKIAVDGPDRAAFLHNMLSNDIKSLTPGRGTYATLLDIKGHIVADLRVHAAEDSLLIDTDADLGGKIVSTLERYIVMDDVRLEPLALATASVQGPRSREVVEKALGTAAPVGEEFAHFVAGTAPDAVRVVRAISTGEEGYEIWAEPRCLIALWEELRREAEARGGLACGSEALESLRIEAGIARYGADFGEDTLPLEAGLLNALSFTKGCYIGQEVVERARSRGHVNWKLIGLAIESATAPPPGEKLLAEAKECGEVTSSCVSPTLGRTIALAFVRREVSQPGAQLTLKSGARARVESLPFYSCRAPATRPGEP